MRRALGARKPAAKSPESSAPQGRAWQHAWAGAAAQAASSKPPGVPIQRFQAPLSWPAAAFSFWLAFAIVIFPRARSVPQARRRRRAMGTTCIARRASLRRPCRFRWAPRLAAGGPLRARWPAACCSGGLAGMQPAWVAPCAAVEPQVWMFLLVPKPCPLRPPVPCAALLPPPRWATSVRWSAGSTSWCITEAWRPWALPARVRA